MPKFMDVHHGMHGITPDALKQAHQADLDIQGDEYLAIQGAKQTLERCSPIIGIEVDNKLARIKGDAVALLKELGYVQFGKAHQDFLFERSI